MLKSKKKKLVYSDTLVNQKGYTLLSMLLAMSILFITLPFLEYITKSLNITTNYTDLSFYQFFHFVRDDLIRSTDFSINGQVITMEAVDKTTVSYEKYQSLIRRQVDGTGHEVLLRNIQDILFEEISYGVKITITTLDGDIYEKKFTFYQ